MRDSNGEVQRGAVGNTSAGTMSASGSVDARALRSQPSRAARRRASRWLGQARRGSGCEVLLRSLCLHNHLGQEAGVVA